MPSHNMKITLEAFDISHIYGQDGFNQSLPHQVLWHTNFQNVTTTDQHPVLAECA